MSRRGMLLVLLAGAGVAAWMWSHGAPSDTMTSSRTPDAVAAHARAGITTVAKTPARADTEVRTFSAKRPLLRDQDLRDIPASDDIAANDSARPQLATAAPARWATVTVTTDAERVTPKTEALPADRRVTSLEPGDEAARAQLVRDIQYELKRAGCYSGDVSGAWTSRTQQAMKEFTQRVNASLSVDKPDYALLALAQGHNVIACSSQCPSGQVATHEGRCLPSSVLAQSGRRRAVAAASRDAADDAANATPLPGRMAVGASAPGRVGDVPTDAVLPQSPAHVPVAVDTRPAVDPRRAAASTARRNAQARPRKGSTRQVFVNLTRNAP